MSATLFYRPNTPIKGEIIKGNDRPLRAAIGKRFWGTDGSIGNGEVVLSSDHMEWLRGLLDAGVPGVDDLISAIEKYGSITVWLEY